MPTGAGAGAGRGAGGADDLVRAAAHVGGATAAAAARAATLVPGAASAGVTNFCHSSLDAPEMRHQKMR